jgi:hypothetical protein
MSTNANAATGMDSAAIDFEVPAPGSVGYDEWRKTGKLPEARESAPVEVEEKPEVKPQVQEEHEAEVEAESPAAKEDAVHAEPAAAQQQGTRKDAAARVKELLAERKKNRDLIDKLTEKLTAAPSAQPSSQTAAQPEAKPQTKVEAAPKPKPSDVDAQGKPKFKDWAAYEDARDEWNRGELLRLVDERNTTHQKSREVQEAEKVIAQGFTAKVVEARKKYPDFDAVALDTSLPIKQGSVVDQFIVSRAVGPDVLYYLGQNSEVLDDLLKLNPLDQAEKLFEISQQFKTAAPKPVPPKPPAKTVTQAPPPPHQVSGKSPTADPVEKAVKDGDQAEFSRLENEKILAARRAKRR